MNEEQQNKISALRRKYIDTTSQDDIDRVEKDLVKAIEDKKLISNPAFQAIVADAEKKINEINIVLMTDSTLEDIERMKLFCKKEAYQFVFNKFNVSLKDKAITDLEALIDYKLNA